MSHLSAASNSFLVLRIGNVDRILNWKIDGPSADIARVRR
jgi:hypothetical protein